MKKKILFLTGTRADYGKLKSLMKAVEADDSYELFVFVTGMHLLPIFGSTYTEVVKDGYKNIYVAYGLTCADTMSAQLGNTISHLTGYVRSINPDMIVVHGDRTDALAGAIVGAFNNVIVVHVEGGEVSGTIDESTRHAISKFAHIHLVAHEEAKKRVIQLGEDPSTIFVIGSPDIDIMLSPHLPTLEEVKQRYELPFDSYGILMYHPVTTEPHKTAQHVKTVTDAVLQSAHNYVVIYPNNDSGSELILQEFSRFSDRSRFAVYPSMRFEYFLTLLKNAHFMIGNSSAGIRESGVYGIPTINIGTRQQGRSKPEQTKHIQHTSENLEEITRALGQIEQHRIKESQFGLGDSTQKFMKILADDHIWQKQMQKKFVDLDDAT